MFKYEKLETSGSYRVWYETDDLSDVLGFVVKEGRKWRCEDPSGKPLDGVYQTREKAATLLYEQSVYARTALDDTYLEGKESQVPGPSVMVVNSSVFVRFKETFRALFR